LEDYTRTVADCTEALEINPKLFQAYYQRGFALEALGKHSEAISDLQTYAIVSNDKVLIENALQEINKINQAQTSTTTTK
jgi:tetratricopeptide (TPR) repeat protein